MAVAFILEPVASPMRDNAAAATPGWAPSIGDVPVCYMCGYVCAACMGWRWARDADPRVCPNSAKAVLALHARHGEGAELRRALQPDLKEDQKPLLLLASYHKTGTVWWEQVWRG